MSYLISIIIPVYNCEKYIERGLKSIINQTFPFDKLEIIVINDKSTDSSLKILNKYDGQYDNLTLIDLKKNHGNPSYPRNIGIKHASSDYIMFMDIDDYYENDACEILYQNAIENNCDIVGGRFYKMYKNIKVKAHSLEKNIYIKNIEEDPKILSENSFLWNKIFKKSLLEKNNIKFTESGVGDVVFTSECFLKAKNILLLKNDYIYTKYITETSISTDKTGKYFDYYLEGLYKLYDIFEENNTLKYFKYFIPMRINHLFKVIVDSEITDEKRIQSLKKLKELIYIASKEGTTFDDRINLLIYLLNSEQYGHIFYFMRYTKVSKKRLTNVKILTEKNKLFKKKIKSLRKRNKLLKNRNIELKNKIEKLSSFKGYIVYKVKNIKYRIINR